MAAIQQLNRKRQADYSIQQDISKKNKNLHVSEKGGYNISDGEKYQNQIKKKLIDLIEIWTFAVSGNNLQSEDLSYQAFARKAWEAAPVISIELSRRIIATIILMYQSPQIGPEMKIRLQYRQQLLTQACIILFE